MVRGVVCALLFVAAVAGALLWTVADPGVAFLRSERGAPWIVADAPVTLLVHREETRTEWFRTRFEVAADGYLGVAVRALRVAAVFLDGARVAQSTDPGSWHTPLHVHAGGLAAGSHELRIEVRNHDGPPAVVVAGETAALRTGEHWENSSDGASWRPVRRAETSVGAPFAREFESAPALASRLPIALVVFAAGFVASLIAAARSWLNASRIRWLLLAGWAVLIVNNLGKLPLSIGFDHDAHLDYIRFVAQRHALPLASDGWQMFQAPLYYVLSAGVYEALGAMLGEGGALRALRIVPLLAGMAQVQLAFVAMRQAFPDREMPRALGTLVGGLLPMNLYMSHYIGNEPLAGCLSAAVVVLCQGALRRPEVAECARFPLVLGAVFGLAVLAKATALLLLLPAALTLVWCASRARRRAAIASMLAAAALVAGWYFVRNWIATGKPLVLSSDNTAWWQQPGYRTPADFLRFGEALVRPVFAGMHGLWDALYSTLWLDGQLGSAIAHETRPPWSYPTMLSTAWLSLLPAVAMLAGAVVVAWRRQPAGLLALGCLALYLAAVAHQFLQLGIYSAGKATYTLGLVPCYALLAGAGFDVLSGNRFARAAIVGGMAVWAVFAYTGYFVL